MLHNKKEVSVKYSYLFPKPHEILTFFCLQKTIMIKQWLDIIMHASKSWEVVAFWIGLMVWFFFHTFKPRFPFWHWNSQQIMVRILLYAFLGSPKWSHFIKKDVLSIILEGINGKNLMKTVRINFHMKTERCTFMNLAWLVFWLRLKNRNLTKKLETISWHSWHYSS